MYIADSDLCYFGVIQLYADKALFIVIHSNHRIQIQIHVIQALCGACKRRGACVVSTADVDGRALEKQLFPRSVL